MSAPPVPRRLAEQHRRRRLASDHRAGRYPRGKVRRAHRAYIRRRWRFLLVATALLLGAGLSGVLFVRSDLGRGVVIGLTVAGTAGVLTHWVVQVTGTGPAMMGDLAERWTASELRPLRRSGFRLVNHFGLSAGDIDHVLIGPPGVLVIETKWSATSWLDTHHERRVADAAKRVAQQARQLSLWAPYRRLELPDAQGLVVLWGPDSEARPLAALGGGYVIGGKALRVWLQEPRPEHVEDEQIATLWAALDKQLRARDLVEASDAPLPESMTATAVKIGASVLLGLVGLLTAGRLAESTDAAWGWLVVPLALVALAHPARRLQGLAVLVTGWQVGVASAALCFLLGVVATQIR